MALCKPSHKIILNEIVKGCGLFKCCTKNMLDIQERKVYRKQLHKKQYFQSLLV